MSTCAAIRQMVQSPISKLFNERNMDKAFRFVEKVSVVALGIFAAVTAPELFIPTFAIGALIGICVPIKASHRHHHHSVEGGCSHGFMEERLGVKLPDSLSLLAGAAVVAVHIDHHADVFVPIVGVTLGVWAGKLVVPSLNYCTKSIKAFLGC